MDLPHFLPKGLFDPYDRPARLYPGLLALMPLPVLLLGLYGPAYPWISGPLSIVSFCGGGYLLGRISRDAGKRLQDRLFTKWGGAPTTQLLRFRDPLFDRHTKERFHRILAVGLGKSMPTADEELADPVAADEAYRAASMWLIGQTRDAKAFPLVFKENIAFGFQRNSLGIRPYGITVATICIAWPLIHAKALLVTQPFVVADRLENVAAGEAVTIVVSIVMMIVWFVFLTESAAKRTAFSYAERLLQSCDHLKSTATSQRTAAKQRGKKSALS